MKRTMLLVAFCMMIGCLITSNALAEDAAAFYKGKTITVLIPTKPGGGFDLASRAISPYLEKYTGAKVLSQNGKMILTENKLYRSKPDGLTIVLAGHGAKEVTAQLFNLEGVSFDWSKLTYLARLPRSSTLFYVNKNKSLKTIEDLRNNAFIHGASSPFFGPLIAEACGFDKMKIVPGMSGSARTMGLRRGEIQSSVGGTGQVAKSPDLLLPLLATNPDPKFPNVPGVVQVAIKGKEKWAKWCAAWDDVVYWSYAPPGIPKDRADFLEKALEKTFNDPGYKADMAKLKFDLSDHFVGQKELKEITKTISDLTADEIKEMKYVIREKYIKK